MTNPLQVFKTWLPSLGAYGDDTAIDITSLKPFIVVAPFKQYKEIIEMDKINVCMQCVLHKVRGG